MYDLIMEEALEDYRSNEYVGVRELADAAERILRELQPEQTKGTVSDYPNERTIRFYLSEGLLPPPTAKRGQSSLFRYRHLITLLVIKKLQSEGLPISVIKSLIADRGIDELEKLLGERVMVFTQKADLDSFIETSGKGENEEVMVMTDPKLRDDYLAAQSAGEGQENEAKEYLSQLLYSAAEPSPSNSAPDKQPSQRIRLSRQEPAPLRNKAASGGPTKVRTWDRIEVEDGVEIHIDHELHINDPRKLSDLFDKVRGALESQFGSQG